MLTLEFGVYLEIHYRSLQEKSAVCSGIGSSSMCSWGSNNKIEKFYKGAQADTPWNKARRTTAGSLACSNN